MPSQGGSIVGNEDDEEVFTSVYPLTQDHHPTYRKISFGKKCLLVLLGVVSLTIVLILVTVFLVNSNLFLQLADEDNVNDVVSSLPQCSPIDTSQLWTAKHQALVVGLGRGGASETDAQNMEIVANTSACKEPPKIPVCREGMVAVDLLGEKVVICGGSECNVMEPRKECWHLRTFLHEDGRPTTQGWRSEFLGFTRGRSGASAVLTDQGWWVTGGLVQSPLPLHPFSGQSPVNSSSIWRSTSLTTTSTTELLELPLDPEKTFVKGPDLPFALHKHCALQIAPGLTLIIGGIVPTSPPATLATSILYNWTSQSWCRMGDLASPRAGLSCALLNNSAEVLVFGGAQGPTNNQGELLSLVSQTWQPGPLLPQNLSLSSSHLTILPGEKVLLAGVGNISSQVFSLTEDGGWDEEGELKQGRQDALFFSLQEENLLCDNTIS